MYNNITIYVGEPMPSYVKFQCDLVCDLCQSSYELRRVSNVDTKWWHSAQIQYSDASCTFTIGNWPCMASKIRENYENSLGIQTKY